MLKLAVVAVLLAARPPSAPPPFPAADPTVPPGSHVELCSSFRTGSDARTVSVVVPDSFTAQAKSPGGCGYSADTDNGASVDLGVRGSLARFKKKQIDPFVGQDGDDGIRPTVTYQSGVPVFGDHLGEILTFQPYDDGVPLDVVVVQAAGVRLSWETAQDHFADQQAEFDRARASLAVLPVNRASCVGRRLGVTYRPPRLVATEDDARNECNLELRHGGYPTHTATLDLSPHGGLQALSHRLSHNPHVRALSNRGGRLSYELVRPSGVLHREVAQQGGVRLTWTARPARWAADRSRFRALLASIEINGV